MIDEYKDIRGDGSIVLYLNKSGSVRVPKWQTRIKIRGVTGYRRQSLRTSDFAAAKIRAVELYDDLNFAVKSGHSLNPHLFTKVFVEYDLNESKSKTTETEKKYWHRVVQGLHLYAVPFFENKRIDNIKTGDFMDYLEYRRTHFKKKLPTNDTLIRERSTLLGVFRLSLIHI